jgi:hypothetical protein
MPLNLQSANSLLPLIGKVEQTLSELDYHISVKITAGELEPLTLHFYNSALCDVEPLLKTLRDQSNDLCSAIEKALGTDGTNPNA